MINQNSAYLSADYIPQFGEVCNETKNHCKAVEFFITISNKIHKIAMRIWHALFPKYRTNFKPENNNLSAPALGTFVNTDVRVSNHATESLEWKKELIRNAEQSIELSANFAGGEVFRDVLALIESRMEKKADLKVHLLLSADLIEKADKLKLEQLLQNFPNRFNYLITDRVYKPFLSEENHVKLLVVDEKYFVIGGTGIHENMTREILPSNFQNTGESWKLKLLDKTQRDSEVIGRGDVSKTMRNQFFNLLRIWEHRTNGRAQSRYFDINPAKNIAISDAFDSEDNLIKAVPLKFVVSGPEHKKKNPIVNEYAIGIQNAKNEIKIANMIFNPAKKIRKCLLERKNAGVQIKGHFNGTENASPLHYVHATPARSHYNLITHAYESTVPNQMYHKKVMTVDEHLTIVGTANLGKKSAKHDYEAIVVMDDTRVASAINKALEQDVNSAREFTGHELVSKRRWNYISGLATRTLLGTYF